MLFFRQPAVSLLPTESNAVCLNSFQSAGGRAAGRKGEQGQNRHKNRIRLERRNFKLSIEMSNHSFFAETVNLASSLKREIRRHGMRWGEKEEGRED